MTNMAWQGCHYWSKLLDYGPGSNVVECAADMLRLLGHNMPVVEG